MCIGNTNTGWLRANKTGVVEFASFKVKGNYREGLYARKCMGLVAANRT